VPKPKTSHKPIWYPTENPTFWYRKAIAPSFYTHEDEITQFERQLEKLRWSQRQGDLEDSHNGHSLQMNLVDEDEFQLETPITSMFNVRIFPFHVVFTYSFGHGISHELGSCPY
jgi:hypothetical protein